MCVTVCVCVGRCGLLTSHDEEEEHHDEGVAKVEQVAERAGNGGFVGKVVEGEEEKVEGSHACGEERPPPPAIVLRTKMEVAEQHGCLHAHHHQHHKRKHDEPKHVVHLARPGGGEKESSYQLFKESPTTLFKQTRLGWVWLP